MQKVVAVLITESKGVVTTLESNPTLLQLKIDAMRNLTDDNFRGDSPRARAAADWRDIWPLLGRAAPLETFPQRIAELEKEIAELVVIWAGRERSGAGHRLPVTSIIEFNRPEPLKIRTDFETR